MKTAKIVSTQKETSKVSKSNIKTKPSKINDGVGYIDPILFEEGVFKDIEDYKNYIRTARVIILKENLPKNRRKKVAVKVSKK